MKKILKLIFLLLILDLNTVKTTAAPAPAVTVSMQLFYDELGPYGTWVNDPDYGYVWIPSVDAGFSPYGTGGYWVNTDLGWTWVSDYPWGWAPFHYGRWRYDPVYAWIWVPGVEWGPAWVTWRRANGYYGWAPMPPGFSFSVGFTYPSEQWVFVHERDFCRHDLHSCYIDRRENVTIISRSSVINNTYEDPRTHSTYVSGPRRDDVQHATGRSIESYKIHESDRPGQKLESGALNVYKPRVDNSGNGIRKPAPAMVSNLKDVKPVSERKAVVGGGGNTLKDNMHPGAGEQKLKNNVNDGTGGQKLNNNTNTGAGENKLKNNVNTGTGGQKLNSNSNTGAGENKLKNNVNTGAGQQKLKNNVNSGTGQQQTRQPAENKARSTDQPIDKRPGGSQTSGKNTSAPKPAGGEMKAKSPGNRMQMNGSSPKQGAPNQARPAPAGPRNDMHPNPGRPNAPQPHPQMQQPHGMKK